jgi:hypothetical protein
LRAVVCVLFVVLAASLTLLSSPLKTVLFTALDTVAMPHSLFAVWCVMMLCLTVVLVNMWRECGR